MHVNRNLALLQVGVMQGCLLDFFGVPKMNRLVDQATNPLYFPHHSSTMAKYALMPRDRPPDVYQWQRSPVQLVGGSSDDEQLQTTDFLLPYWMGRAMGLIPAV